MRALRISLLLQRSSLVLWVGRLCCCFASVHEAGTAKECLTIKVRLFFPPPLSLFLFLAQSIASRWIAGALKVANSTVYSGKMWWNTCAIRKKSFHIPTDSCIFPDFKADKGYTHSLLQIMPGPSWINSHFGLSLLHYICLKRTWTEPAQL